MHGSRLQMLILLIPKPAVDIAALEELVVTTDVINTAALEHEDFIGAHQHG
jgi:hypothetical protein